MSDITIEANGLSFSAIDRGEGPVVLMLHGFPDTFHTFEAQVDAFVAAGYRCIVPAMRGYEPSSIPSHYGLVDFSVACLAGDVIAWLDSLGVTKVHLVGHDWGAVVSYAVAAQYPARVCSLTAMAVPPLKALKAGVKRYPVQIKNSAYMALFQVPEFSDWALKRNDFQLLDRLWRAWSPSMKSSAQALAPVKAAFSQPGVVKAVLSYYRALTSAHNRRSSAILEQPIHVPSLLLTGTEDGCMDTRLYDCVPAADFPAGVKVERVDHAGHFLHQEQPDTVNRLLLSWFSAHAAN